MTEATQVNEAIRRNLGPLGRFRRVEHAIDAGWPDWYYRTRVNLASGWIEAKLLEPGGWPRKLTLAQVAWAEEETTYGGRCFLLALQPRNRAWFLYDPAGARALYERRVDVPPLVTALGAFPTKEIWRRLTCPSP